MKKLSFLVLGFGDCNCICNRYVHNITTGYLSPYAKSLECVKWTHKALVAAADLLYGPHTVNLPTQLFRNGIHENMLALKKLAVKEQTSKWKGVTLLITCHCHTMWNYNNYLPFGFYCQNDSFYVINSLNLISKFLEMCSGFPAVTSSVERVKVCNINLEPHFFTFLDGMHFRREHHEHIFKKSSVSWQVSFTLCRSLFLSKRQQKMRQFQSEQNMTTEWRRNTWKTHFCPLLFCPNEHFILLLETKTKYGN